MNFKVNENKWEELAYLINNFYTPAKYTCGKGIYPDRVTFKRSNDAKQLFEPNKDVEFFIFNARSSENSKSKIIQTRNIVESKVTNSYFMNEALNYNNKQEHKYIKLFDYMQDKLLNSKTTNYSQLNNFLIKAYKLLNPKDALKVAEFREDAFNTCVEEQFISREFAKQQIDELPNSLMRLSMNDGAEK